MTLCSQTRLLLGSPLLMVSFALNPALAQTGVGFSQLDVRPPDATASLNASLTRLGANPRDVSALIGAGEAALALDDPRAATGFFARADEIQGGNGRVKAGLGRAMLKLQNPTEALKLFSQAEQLRYSTDSFIGDRALARDLTGDQAGAQRDYQLALQRKRDDAELIRRYAVSLGISGQVAESEKIIEPLLYKNDRAAWRNRAFVLAMNGRDQEARVITQKVMPKPLADAIQPYMDRMAALTPAQRAAAVHFGNFPSNAGVRMAANTNNGPRTVIPGPIASAAAVDTRSTAKRPSVSTRFRNVIPLPPSQTQSVPAQTTTAPTLRPDARAQATAAIPIRTPALVPTDRAEPIPPTTPASRPAVPVVQPQRTAPATGAATGSAAVQGPIDPAPRSTRWAAATPTVVSPAVAQQLPQVQQPASPAPSPVATRTLADIIRELDVPETERRSQIAAVDLSEIAALQNQKRLAARAAADKVKRDAAAKVKAEADVKAKALAAEKARLAKNPSRNWVQVGTGQSISALGFTLRGLRKKYDSLSAKDGYTAPWGRTNRLIVGPFASFAKAKDFEATLKKNGADVFTWQSEAGEEVAPVK